MKRWVSRPVDEAAAAGLAAAVGLSPAAACVLAGRGLRSRGEVDRFLNPRLSDITDPFLLTGMSEAVERIAAAIEGGERIAVYGDYDADGVTASALLIDVLRRLGATADVFLPEREEDGYGLTVTGFQRCVARGRPDVIVTVDCGVSGLEAGRLAAEAGIDLVITDHHELPAELPPHVALVNPKRDGDETVRMLAGVGVAFKLAHALVKRGRDRGWARATGLDLRDYLEWVAIGTLADVVPLTGENRILARHGMARLGQTAHPGLRALIEVARVRGAVDSYHVAFVLAPRINAAGRMGSPDDALALFLAPDAEEGAARARRLDEANGRRREIEETILREAVSQIEGTFDPARHFGAVVSGADWHAGVMGIVAARLCRRLQRPVVAITFAGGEAAGRGSARSLEPFDLVAGLSECADLLTGFGGHRAAAGLTIEAARLDAFRQRFEEVCAARLAGADLEPALTIDAWVELSQLDWALHDVLEQLKPFGQGNPAPVLAARELTVVGAPRVVGDSHLRFVVASGGRQMTAIAFNMAARGVPEGSIDLAFTLRSNDFTGRPVLELNVEDIRPAAGA